MDNFGKCTKFDILQKHNLRNFVADGNYDRAMQIWWNNYFDLQQDWIRMTIS